MTDPDPTPRKTAIDRLTVFQAIAALVLTALTGAIIPTVSLYVEYKSLVWKLDSHITLSGHSGSLSAIRTLEVQVYGLDRQLVRIEQKLDDFRERISERASRR